MKTTNIFTKSEVLSAVQNIPARSAWKRGVKLYASDLLDTMPDVFSGDNLRSALLNGADTWAQYSEGGCSLIYNEDIAERLCSPSELRRVNGGRWNPHRGETWLDVQSRALYQAAYMIETAVRELAAARDDDDDTAEAVLDAAA